MSSKKRFPKDGIRRSKVRPRQSKKARETYGKGFNIRGTPTTCGYPTEWGECAAYQESGGLCPIHAEQDREKRKTETIEDRHRMWREGEARAARADERLRRKMGRERERKERGS